MNVSYNPYTPEEIKRIKQLEFENDQTDEFFKKQRGIINEKVFDIIKLGDFKNFNVARIDSMSDFNSSVLNCRQELYEQIATFRSKFSTAKNQLKTAEQNKLIFYMTGYSLKAKSAADLRTFIDAHIAQEQRETEILENYIDFLRDTIKTLDTIGYTAKNTVEWMNYLK